MNSKTNTARFNRILVVDDTTANLLLLTNQLTEHSYIVHPASDDELAFRFFQSINPSRPHFARYPDSGHGRL